ncbi:hypothetical protein F4861DRAFT_161793 [Xylaria intraflava]|nr:hypothetical protein F4861DRAFT_161793 [Xylaria intraflava]
MTNGRPQDQAHSGSEALPDCSGAPMETATTPGSLSTSSSASSALGNSEDHIQNGSPPARLDWEQNDSTIRTPGHDSRSSLGPREIPADMMDEIRKLIRQESVFRRETDMTNVVLGVHTLKDHARKPAGDDGDLGPVNTNTNNGSQEKRLSYPDTMAKTPIDERNDGLYLPTVVSEPMATPLSALSALSSSPPISAQQPSILPPVATKLESPRIGVRFSDGAPPSRSPYAGPASGAAKKTPWSMYRRISSSSGESVPEWGVLFDKNGFVTARCAQVFRGLARCLAEESPSRDAVLVTPEKLGLLYSRFRIEGEVYPFEDIFHIFSRQASGVDTRASISNNNRLTTYYNRISDFFADLDCEYYLVPPPKIETALILHPSSALSVSSPSAETPSSPMFPRSSSYSSLHPDPTPSPNQYTPVLSRIRHARPCIPALTLDGFAQFLTICVLAHPDEEAKRLDKIVSELALEADVPPSNSIIHSTVTPNNTPTSPSTPLSSVPRQLPSTGAGLGTSGRGEKLPRQFVRSLFPVKVDVRSRKLLSVAVEDLLYDLRLSDSSFSSSSGAVFLTSASTPAPEPVEQNGRRPFTTTPTNPSSGSNSGRSRGVPHLPPPPVPTSRNASGNGGACKNGDSQVSSAPKPLPSSSSAGSLVKFRTASPPPIGPRGYHRRHSYYEHRRQGPVDSPHKSLSVVALKSRSRAAGFELGDTDEELDGDSASSDTVTTVAVVAPRLDRRGSYHGRERERAREKEKERERYRESHKERDRNRDRDRDQDHDHDRDRDRDRDRAKGHDRRPDPAPRRQSDRRWGGAAGAPSTNTMASGATTGGNSAGDRNGQVTAVVVGQKHDDLGPTWSEVIRAQQQQGTRGVTFSDERDRSYA